MESVDELATTLKIRFGRSGIHLFDRRTGWNVLLDEVPPPQSAWASAPRQVSIALTNACDLSCDYCFAPKAHSSLAFDRVTSWVLELDANGTVGIGFGGGEPTLYPRFAELCVFATRRTRLAVTFTTHGHHLHEDLLQRLEGFVHFIRISMDGVGDTYQRLRRRSFNVLLQRLQAVRRISRFGINYVVNDDTLPELEPAVRLADELGAAEFLLLPERAAHGRPGITDAAGRKLREWVASYRGNVPLSTSDTGAHGLPVCEPFACDAPLDRYAHIDATGVVKGTSFDKAGVPISETFLKALSELRNLHAVN